MQYGKDTAYDVVHLLAALDLKDVNKAETHDQMTAVIRYKTPYTVASKGPFILSIALGHDVNLHSVLGLPTLLEMGADINLITGLLLCSEFNREFPLDLQPPGRGLLESVSLNRFSPNVPTSVPANPTHTNSQLHHTAAEGSIQPERSRTPSHNILVTDHFFNDNVTRELKYFPSNSDYFAVFS